MGDINNDGYPDLFTTDMLPGDDYRLKTTGAFDNINLFNSKLQSGFYYQYVKNCLQLNNRNGRFIEIGNFSGVSATDWSWGALMFDADNDGYNDIYVCNGVNRDVTDLDFLNFFADNVYQKMALSGKKESIDELLKKIPRTPLLSKMFRNLGNLKFQDIGESWGFTRPSWANGAAYGDLDNDGALDLVVNNENGQAFVYRNNSREMNKNNYIGVFLKGNSPNTFAIGSQIRVFAGNQVLYREVVPSRGFQSSVDYKQLIGLGKLTEIDSMTITWPDRTTTHITHPGIDTVHTIQQSESTKSAWPAPAKETVVPQPFLAPVTSSFDKHQEDNNTDFLFERNLPKMLSREGPKAACGDVNGDGLTDIYIGGTSRNPGQLYLQTATGGFVKSPQPAFGPFMDFEDEAVLLFDADNDGDLDLFVGPGGNNNPPYSRQMQLRLFKNDGHGHFTLDADAFPASNNGCNTGVAVAGDFNKDGYPDLFIGGRSIPREYGASPSSYVFINDGQGHFKDIAADRNPQIAHIGMVTSACWADLTGQGQPQLLIAGEWMAPRLFTFKKDRFEEIPTSLEHLFGWWESAAVRDLDGDGRPDLILGNIGENFYLRPDSTHPVKLWLADFDHNGIMDKVMTRTIDGRDMPVFLKHDMEDQIPSLKKQNLKHAEYAKRSIQDLFPAPEIDSAIVKQFDFCSSIVAFNRGNGKFAISRLPDMVQLSSVNAIISTDVNGDGHPDLVLGGNEFGFLPQFGRLDGSLGDILLNDGTGRFTFLYPDRTGLQLTGQVRDIALLPAKSGVYLLFLQNNEKPALYKLKP
ncbi:MAG TPA: VCBS repeat-containing protein, partial [Puia sp.]|nr:VCBS repeat-containing protein [Puia sp.]